MDFTLKTYQSLLCTLGKANYRFYTFEEYCERKTDLSNSKFIILRHDVDEIASNALKMAELEYEAGVRATYYFRMVKQSFDPTIIKRIAALEHEIGYHYEDLSFTKGNIEKAVSRFEKNLQELRVFYPIRTVCMHGSSTSLYDNRAIWKHHQLSDFGLIGEPYLTTDFEQVFYITDTGYAWDGGKYAVRDVVKNNSGLTFHCTWQIISCIEEGKFPSQCLMLAHTLWTDNLVQWIALHFRELLRNNVKRWARQNKLVKWGYAQLVKLYWKQ